MSDPSNPLPPFSGTSIYMGGQNWVIPSLSVRQFREHEAALTSAPQEKDFGKQLDTLLPVIRSAMSRNYPSISDDELRDMLDLGNFFNVVRAISGQSGLKEVAPGE